MDCFPKNFDLNLEIEKCFADLISCSESLRFLNYYSFNLILGLTYFQLDFDFDYQMFPNFEFYSFAIIIAN